MVDLNLGTAATVAKSGYLLEAKNDGSGPPALGYGAGAAPQTWNQTGNRDFCSVQDAVLRFKQGALADVPETTGATCTSATYTIMQ